MNTDAQTVRQDAEALGWVARTEPFDSAVPIASGIKKQRSRFFSKLFSAIQSTAFSHRTDTPGATRPAVVDWREKSVISPAEHQQDVNACVSYATCAVADARGRMRGTAPAQLAPRHLHFCLMKLDRKNGTSIELLARTALAAGLPYDIGGAGNIRSRKECPVTHPADALRVAALYKFAAAEEAKRELAQHGPLVAQMELHEDFMKWYGGGVYRPSGTAITGSHAVTLVGYDDQRGYWIGKNSFGQSWGEDGFFRLAYGTSGLLTGADPAFSLDLLV